MTVYLANADEVPDIHNMLKKAMQKYCKDTRPAMTGITVHKLFLRELHIEIAVEAHLVEK